MTVRTIAQQAAPTEGFLDYFLPRNPVTQSRELRLVPQSVELALGKYLYPVMVESKGGRCYTKNYQELVETVGKRLAKHTDRSDLPFEFTVIDSSVVNAWCIAGGKIAFYRGLIEKLEREDNTFGVGHFTLEEKIAAVMAHEETHACARHTARSLEFAVFLTAAFKVLQYALSFFIAKTEEEIKQEKAKSEDPYKNNLSNKHAMLGVARTVDTLFDYSYNLIFKLLQTHGSRQHELEADRYGMLYLKRAGYNPKTAIWLQEFFAKQHPHDGGFLDCVMNLFSTHPTSEERAALNRKTFEDLNKGLLK